MPSPAGLVGQSVTHVAAGGSHSLVVCDGILFAFGSNQYGECDIPQGLQGQRVRHVAAGGYYDEGFSIAVREDDGHIFAFGANGFGQCNIPAGLQGKAVGISLSVGYEPSLHTSILSGVQQRQVEQALLCLSVIPDDPFWIPEDTALHALGYLDVRVAL